MKTIKLAAAREAAAHCSGSDIAIKSEPIDLAFYDCHSRRRVSKIQLSCIVTRKTPHRMLFHSCPEAKLTIVPSSPHFTPNENTWIGQWMLRTCKSKITDRPIWSRVKPKNWRSHQRNTYLLTITNLVHFGILKTSASKGNNVRERCTNRSRQKSSVIQHNSTEQTGEFPQALVLRPDAVLRVVEWQQ